MSYSFPFSCCVFKAVWSEAPRIPGKFILPLSLHREKKISRSSALKVLDHAMIGPEGTDNCHKFVDILGLRTIFPLFMKSPKKIKKVGTTEKEHEGRCASRSCPASWRRGTEGKRLGSACTGDGGLRGRRAQGTAHPGGAGASLVFPGLLLLSSPSCLPSRCRRPAVVDMLALLVLVSAVPGDSISCTVISYFTPVGSVV